MASMNSRQKARPVRVRRAPVRFSPPRGNSDAKKAPTRRMVPRWRPEVRESITIDGELTQSQKEVSDLRQGENLLRAAYAASEAAWHAERLQLNRDITKLKTQIETLRTECHTVKTTMTSRAERLLAEQASRTTIQEQVRRAREAEKADALQLNIRQLEAMCQQTSIERACETASYRNAIREIITFTGLARPIAGLAMHIGRGTCNLSTGAFAQDEKGADFVINGSLTTSAHIMYFSTIIHSDSGIALRTEWN